LKASPSSSWRALRRLSSEGMERILLALLVLAVEPATSFHGACPSAPWRAPPCLPAARCASRGWAPPCRPLRAATTEAPGVSRPVRGGITGHVSLTPLDEALQLEPANFSRAEPVPPPRPPPVFPERGSRDRLDGLEAKIQSLEKQMKRMESLLSRGSPGKSVTINYDIGPDAAITSR
jgi:hypothetical protein